jgi:hypothetical protein
VDPAIEARIRALTDPDEAQRGEDFMAGVGAWKNVYMAGVRPLPLGPRANIDASGASKYHSALGIPDFLRVGYVATKNPGGKETRLYQCPVPGCVESWASQEPGYRHLRESHLHLQFQCPKCGKGMLGLQEIQRHVPSCGQDPPTTRASKK